jgi:hypothetical protein
MKLTKLLASLVLIGICASASADVVTQASPGSVSLDISKNCVINTGLSGTGYIGAVQPFLGIGDYLASSDQAKFNCTNTTPYTVDVNKNLLGLTGPVGFNIPYTAKIIASSVGPGGNGTAAALGSQSGGGVGGGMSAAQEHKVTYEYKILGADILDVKPGSYSDLTLALKITF